MKYGSGSVTTMLGQSGLMGTPSPNQAATSPPQRPATLTRRRACAEAGPASTSKVEPVQRAPSTFANSRMSAPAARAARAKAGATRRGLACPSSAQSEAPTTFGPSQG